MTEKWKKKKNPDSFLLVRMTLYPDFMMGVEGALHNNTGSSGPAMGHRMFPAGHSIQCS